MPDKLKVNGDLLSGQIDNGRNKAQFFYWLKTPFEKSRWQSDKTVQSAVIKIKTIKEIDGARNPGEFDFKRYSNHHHVFQTVEIDKITNLRIAEPHDLTGWIYQVRISFINYLQQLPKWLRIHTQSLLVGYSGPNDNGVLQTLSVLGIIHLFSLSGLHVLLLITILKKITSALHITIEFIDWILLLILPIFAIFVGLKTGICRAVVLSIVTIILKKFSLKSSKLDIFALTVLICLWIDPFALIEMGGQLSFVLAGSLLYLTAKSIFESTLKMNLVSLPIICFYTYQFNLLILLMNIVFVPIFMYLILPTTILAAIFPSFLSIWNVFNDIFSYMYSLMDRLSQLSELNLVIGQFPIVIVLVLLILALLQLNQERIWRRPLKYFCLLFISTVIYIKIPIFGSVSIIDVGQGDSILVTTPGFRKIILIDTAGKLGFPQKPWQKRITNDQVKQSTIPYLHYRGIKKIDEVFLSHKDVDHIGNLTTLLDSFPVQRVNFGIGLEQNKRIKDTIDKHPQIIFQKRKRGDDFQIGRSNWQVLWPNKKSIGENGDSLTLLSEQGTKKWLFTGDLDIENENKILELGAFKIDYLKAGHHGSKTASGDKLLDQTRPQIAFISAGRHNRYGHPNKETLSRLKEHQIKSLNTADCGMITWYYYPFGHERLTTFLRKN